MEGTSLLTDGAINHDHSYYGNGCTNPFDTTKPNEGYGGSTKSCSTRILSTADNEYQKNGTYYNFQAATDGTGAAIATDNTDSSDTFCPLGWQLPYGGKGGDYYDKSRSFKYLITAYNYSGLMSKVASYPLSYVKPGDYRLALGRLFEMTHINHQWTSINAGSNSAYRIYETTWVYSDAKTIAMTVRCVTRK